MLSLEAIGVLGVLYALLVWGLVRAALAARQVEQKVEEGAAVAAEGR